MRERTERHRYFDPENNEDIRRRLEEIKREMRREWASYKVTQECLSDAKIEGSELDAFILWAIKKGILGQE